MPQHAQIVGVYKVTALAKTMVEIADYLRISQPAANQLYRRGEAWAKVNEPV